jgi:AraC family transcriptional regulator
MSLTNKALWVIERHLDRALTLGELAEACGVSRYHLAHAFGAAAGMPLMQYVRARRLTEAAHRLASGQAPDILGLALDSGYGSHEAFSRAFRSQFGTTPEKVRRQRSAETLPTIKALKPRENAEIALPPPRFVTGAPMFLVGLSERHLLEATERIPAQWQRFMASYNEISHKVGPRPLAVTGNMDDEGTFEYVCAVQVHEASELPEGLAQLRVPAQHYAVFQHPGHVASIAATYSAIWNHWLPAHKRKAADGPSLERHHETFNAQTGLGGLEIWIALAPTADQMRQRDRGRAGSPRSRMMPAALGRIGNRLGKQP